MATQHGGRSAGQVEPDRVGRMGGRHGPEPTVRGQLARRLKGHAGVTRPRSAARPAGLLGVRTAPDGAMQRVVVKVRVSRHSPGRARAGLVRHVTYLGRDGAGRDGEPAPFYAAQPDTVPAARSNVATWAGDRHHFRLIVSPEREVPDLNGYVRAVVRAAERDLGTRLDWLAVNHHDTDDPHAHVLVRGRLPDGRDLVIPRRYLTDTLRQRAAEVATEVLGPRTADRTRERAELDVKAERFTWLDRTIVRRLEGDRIDVSPARWTGADDDEHRAVIARLQFLATAGLAARDGGTGWQLAPAFGQALRELDARGRGASRVQVRTAEAGADAPRRASVGVDRARSAPAHDDAVVPAGPAGGRAIGTPPTHAVVVRRTLPVGGSVAGTYAGVERTPGGRRALVATEDGVFAVAVDRPPALQIGMPVEASRTATGTHIELVRNRDVSRSTPARGSDLEAGR